MSGTDMIIRWYCQPDGGQWNVRVEVDAREDDCSIIKSKQLVGTYTDSDGFNWLIVATNTLFDEPQGI